MSNYLFYTLLGYAAGLITSLFIEVSIDKKYQQIEERMWNNAKAKENEQAAEGIYRKLGIDPEDI